MRPLRLDRGLERDLRRLVDDLLDVSRIISGKLRLEVRPVELTSVIEAAGYSPVCPVVVLGSAPDSVEQRSVGTTVPEGATLYTV